MPLPINLAVAAILWASVLGCSKPNRDFCEMNEQCQAGQECSGNRCVAGTDAAPDLLSCRANSHQCLAPVPEDWTGPTMRVDTSNDASLPECAISETEGFVAGIEFESAGTCHCECTTADTVNCTDASIEAVPGASVGCTLTQCAGGCLGQELVPGTCTAMIGGLLDENNVRMTAGTLTGGTCLSGNLAAITPAAEFDDVIALCAAEIAEGDCGVGETCAPVAAPEFTGQSCIYREGTHDCPGESKYSERTLSFAELADNRSCGSCDCELPPAGTSCEGATTSCNIEGVTQTAGCISSDDWAVGATAFRYDPDPAEVDCVPVEANPALAGSVAGVDATTICCTPAQ